MPDRAHIVPGEAVGEAHLAVALDGAMIHIRGEGWKELKTGCVGEIEVGPSPDPVTGDLVDMAHTVAHTYVAHLGGPERFGQQLWAEAQARHFFDSRQGVDWYHAKQHLAQAATLVAGEGTPAAKHWLTEHATCLFEGHADQIAAELDQVAKGKRKIAKDLRLQAGYFRDNQRRMQYLELREDGYPIGSGMVEGGCKQFRSRFTGSGMRWSRPGAERLLPVRAAIMSHRFDAFWTDVYRPPLN